jgi:hypothetical protein
VAAAAVAAGCGSSSEDSGSAANADVPEVTTSSLSKAQFVKQANALCGKEKTKAFQASIAFARKYESEGKPQSKLLAELTSTVILPRIEREITGIADLGAPAGDEAQIEAFLTAENEAADKVAADLKGLKSLRQIEAQFSDSGKLARAYGITGCDNSSG